MLSSLCEHSVFCKEIAESKKCYAHLVSIVFFCKEIAESMTVTETGAFCCMNIFLVATEIICKLPPVVLCDE